MRQRLGPLAGNWKVLLLVVLLVALLAAVYPRLQEYVQAGEVELQRQLEQRRSEVRNLRSLNARRLDLEARLERSERALETLKQQLEKGRQQPSFLTYLESNAVRAGVVITALGFEAPQPVTAATTKPAAGATGAAPPPASGSAQPPAGAAKPAVGQRQEAQQSTGPLQSAQRQLEGAEKATGQQPQAQPAPGQRQEAAPAEAPKVAYLRYPVSLRAHGPYPGVVELVGRLEGVFPLVAVDKIAIATPSSADKGKQPAESLPAGWVRMELTLSVLANADGSTGWARELAELARGLGRANPFLPDTGVR